MGLLAEARISTLKKMPSQLWSKPIQSPNSIAYVFDAIGSIKSFNETKVRLNSFPFKFFKLKFFSI